MVKKEQTPSTTQAKPKSQSLLEKYANQEIQLMGVVTAKMENDVVAKKVITLRTKDGEIYAETEGKEVFTEEELDDEINHLAYRYWLEAPWEAM